MKINMKRIIVIGMLIMAVVLSGCIGTDSSTSIHASQPCHHIPYDERHDPMYVNYNDDVNDRIIEVCSEFAEYTPVYMRDEVDCNDMAVYLWNKLQEKGIKTVLVLGSVDGERTPFGKCDHVWLRCLTPNAGYTIEPTMPAIFYNNGYDTFRTSDEVEVLVFEYMIKRKSSIQPGFKYKMDDDTCEKEIRESYKSRFIEDTTESDKYDYGFYYAKPSDLRDDLGDRW